MINSKEVINEINHRIQEYSCDSRMKIGVTMRIILIVLIKAINKHLEAK